MIMLKDETVKMKENSGDSFSDTNGKKWISVFSAACLCLAGCGSPDSRQEAKALDELQ